MLLVSACSSRPPARVGAPVAPAPGDTERGLASWYGDEFAGLPTASGETFDPSLLTAAHRTLPLGTVADVTNEKNGRTVRVTVNDRGPFVAGRIVDLSRGAAAEIGSVVEGVVPVTLTVVTVGSNERVPSGGRLSDQRWAVQAGAFASEENAARLRDLLAARYPSPWLEEFRGLTRVKFGPYPTRSDADAARATLGDLGLAGVVVPY